MKFLHRQHVIAWSWDVAHDDRVVYLDTETTSLARDGEVVDIAVIGANGETLFDRLVKPSRPIPESATVIHGIDDTYVATAQTWPEIYPELAYVLRDRRVIVYNAPFDARIVNQVSFAHNLPALAFFWECAMSAFSAFLKTEFTTGRRGYSLDTAAELFALKRDGHRAAADARVCRDVVRGMAGVLRPAEVKAG